MLSLEDQAYFGAVFGRLSGCLLADNCLYGIQAIHPGAPRRPRLPLERPHRSVPPRNQPRRRRRHGERPRALRSLAGGQPRPPAPAPGHLPARLRRHGLLDTVTVEYLGGAEELLYGYSVQITWDPAVVTRSRVERPATAASPTPSLPGAAQGRRHRLSTRPWAAVRRASPRDPCSRCASRPWARPTGHASAVVLELLHARDRLNHEIAGFVTDDGVVSVDMQPPVIASVTLHNETLDHTDEFAKDGDLISASRPSPTATPTSAAAACAASAPSSRTPPRSPAARRVHATASPPGTRGPPCSPPPTAR